MTDENHSTRGRIGNILNNDRARIPLAIVGALLLISAVTVVGHIETRESADPNVDASIVIDQTEAATQTAVRDGAQRATKLAAEQPLTAPANNSWGDVIATADGTSPLSNDPFENYLRALIYLEVQKTLDTAGQETDDVQTDVTVPDVEDEDDLKDAIERVEISGGDDGSLDVTIDGITMTATREGEVIERETKTMKVTVVTPILQLHDRVEKYQYALNRSGLTEPGLKQRFNARIYALGWARGWAQNYQAPISEIIANRHIEPSTNSALFRTQQDVFGTADPALRDAVRLGWACMAIKDGAAMFDQYTDGKNMSYADLQLEGNGNDGYELAYNDSYAARIPPAFDSSNDLCTSTHLLLERFGNHPSAPSVMDLIGGTNLLKTEETLGINETAYIALTEMADAGYEDSFENVIQRIYSMETESDTQFDSYGTLDFDGHNCSRHEYPEVEKHISNVAVAPLHGTNDGNETMDTIDKEKLDEDGKYYKYSLNVVVEVSKKWDCRDSEGTLKDSGKDVDSFQVEMSTVFRERSPHPHAKIVEHNPSAEIDDTYKYNSGPGDWPAHKRFASLPEFSNYEGVGNSLTARFLGYTHDHDSTIGVPLPPCIPDCSNLTDAGESGPFVGTSVVQTASPSPNDGVTENSKIAYKRWLEHRLSEYHLDYDSAVSEYSITKRMATAGDVTKTLQADSDSVLDGYQLSSVLTEEIREMQEATANVSVTFERKDMINSGDESPYNRLIEEYKNTIKPKYIDTHDDYRNVGEMVVYEARLAYYETVLDYLEGMDSAHEKALGKMDGKLADADSSLQDATRYLHQGLNSNKPEPTELRSPALTDNITYEVNGSPTYLLSETTVQSQQVPAVDDEFAALRTKNTEFFDLPYDEVIDGLIGSVLDTIPGGGLFTDEDAELSFRMAGDLLMGLELAAEADNATEGKDYLGEYHGAIDDIRGNVEESIDEFKEDAAMKVAINLNPSPESDCILRGKEPNYGYQKIVTWEKDKAEMYDYKYGAVTNRRSFVEEKYVVECGPVKSDYNESRNREWAELKDQIENAENAIESGIDDALDDYGTAQQARLIGSGNATELIIENVTQALSNRDTHNHEYDFSAHYDGDQWETVLDSAVRPAVVTAASKTVDIGDADTVERLDNAVSTAIANATKNLARNRLEDISDGSTQAIKEKLGSEKWIGNENWNRKRAARVPAGLPLLPVPGYWYMTANAWSIEIDGQYARFEVTANLGTPETTTSTTYVRENKTVEYEIGGETRELGRVEAISFSRRTILVVIVPRGVGVGDRDSDNPECSPTYPDIGEIDDNGSGDVRGSEKTGIGGDDSTKSGKSGCGRLEIDWSNDHEDDTG
jgi:frataxin-like iron-binding protein CyaY